MIPGTMETADNRMETPVVVSREVRDRVTVGPPGDWVKGREVDESFRHAASYSALLSDRQHHASRNEDYYRVVRRLETRQALQELGQWRLDFDPRTQHVVIHAILLLRDGVITEHAHADRFRFLQREGGLESQVIDGWITLVVLLEDMRIGDLVDVSFTVHTAPVFLPGRSWVFTTVPSQAALRAFHLSVRFESGRAMQWKSNDAQFAPVVTEQDGETEWSWTKENLQLEEKETNVPPWHFSGTWVQVTDCTSWAEIAAGIDAVWQEDMESPELLQMAGEITAAAPTLHEQVDRAMTMVQDDIRYLSVNVDLGGQIPAAPGTVLRRRYGDCKDKAFLLSHLLRMLGVKAWPVLVNTSLRQAVEELLPSPAVFNHAIVKYELEGQTRWVDATLSLQGGGALARLVPDYRSGLPVGSGIAGLEKIPSITTREERYELLESFSLDSRPGHYSILNVNIKATGWNAENLRRSFANVGEAEMARSREQFYKQMFPDIRRSGTLAWEDNRERDEFKLSESYDVRDAAKVAGNKTCIFQYQSHYIQSILGIGQVGQRKHPYLLPFPCNVEHNVEMETTSSVNIASSPPLIEQGATLRFSRDQRRKGNRIVVTFTLKTLTSEIAPMRFEAHKKLVDKIWPLTFFSFQFPQGLPAPQRRNTPGKQAMLPGATEQRRASTFVKNAQPLPVHGPPSGKRRRGRGRRNREEQEPAKITDSAPEDSSKYTLWIAVILIVVVAALWLFFVSSLLKG